MRTALVQMTSSDDPDENRAMVRDLVTRAVTEEGAGFVLTPEVTNCVSTSRDRQRAVLRPEGEDATLADLRALAVERGIWILAGSLAIALPGEERFANRSFLLAPDGKIAARYDKIHMFDVSIDARETHRESDGFRPGDRAVVATTPFARIGMAICYDLRFPGLFRHLALRGADVLTVPAAFTPVSGAAHWHTLLRARAIECGAWVLAPAQTGHHAIRDGSPRETYGHGLVVDPWGEVVLDMGTEPGIAAFDLDVDAVDAARRRIPSLRNGRPFADA
jgi:predicted amidohydrolase